MFVRKWAVLGAAIAMIVLVYYGVDKGHSVKKAEIWVGFDGTTAQDKDVIYLQKALSQDKIQGVILFSHNIVHWAQTKKLIEFFKEAKSNIKIAIDQEGGKVLRLSTAKGFKSGSMLAANAYENLDQCIQIHTMAAKEMNELGLTDVFGPVVDVNINPACPAIGALGRSFSDHPDTVAEYANAIIDVYKNHGLRACLKHAPGHGSATRDSHDGVTDITNTWSEKELIPFEKCILLHPEISVMMGHLMLRAIDPDYPASMSKKIIDWFKSRLQNAGAEKMPFLIADGYEMKAVSSKYNQKEFLDICSKAGIHAVLFYCCRQSAYYPENYSLQQMMEEKLGIVLPSDV